MSDASKPSLAGAIVKHELAFVVERKVRGFRSRTRGLISHERITVNREHKIHDLVGVVLVDDVNKFAITSEGQRHAVASFD